MEGHMVFVVFFCRGFTPGGEASRQAFSQRQGPSGTSGQSMRQFGDSGSPSWVQAGKTEALRSTYFWWKKSVEVDSWHPIIYSGFSTIPGGCLGFLNHPLYLTRFWWVNIKARWFFLPFLGWWHAENATLKWIKKLTNWITWRLKFILLFHGPLVEGGIWKIFQDSLQFNNIISNVIYPFLYVAMFSVLEEKLHKANIETEFVRNKVPYRIHVWYIYLHLP